MNRYELHIMAQETSYLIFEVEAKDGDSAIKQLNKKIMQTDPLERKVLNIDFQKEQSKVYLVETNIKKARKKKSGVDYGGNGYSHVACPSYPNCDLGPMGCRLAMGDEVEEYGMRD